MDISDGKTAFHSISSMKSENTNSDKLTSISNRFFPPFISLSNNFHSHLAFLQSFLSIPSLSFCQIFPFLRPPGFIPPLTLIRPKTTPTHHYNNNVFLPFTPSFITKSKNLKKYKCDICSRAFSRTNTLVTHKRIHTGEKPFICNICDRAFRQPGNLTRHRLIHTAIKPYVCRICPKTFNRLSNLQSHQRIHSLITRKENELNVDQWFFKSE